MLNSELNDQILALVAESGETGGTSVEFSISRSLQTLHVIPFSGFEHEFTIVVLVF